MGSALIGLYALKAGRASLKIILKKRPEEQIMKCQPSLVTINARLLLKRRLPHIIDIIRSEAITRNGVGSRFVGNIMRSYACRGA